MVLLGTSKFLPQESSLRRCPIRDIIGLVIRMPIYRHVSSWVAWRVPAVKASNEKEQPIKMPF